MIENHPDLECPPDDTVVWRFMDFTKFVSLLHTSSLHFAQLSQMKDTYEGALSKPTADSYNAMLKRGQPRNYEALHTSNRAHESFLRGSMYVSSWHMNTHQSAAMWDLYLSSKEGVAIKCTIGDLREAFSVSSNVVYPSKIKYIDYRTDSFPWEQIFFRASHKRKSFEHESEFRLIWWAWENRELLKREGLLGDDGFTYAHIGRKILINPTPILKHVYVSPYTGDWFRDVVAGVLEKYGHTCPCTKSDLYDSPLW